MRPPRAPHKADRDLLLRLVTPLSVSKTRLRRDGCGDWNIVGRRGHISTDGTAMYVYLACKTMRRWEAAKSALSLTVVQDGDLEGIVLLHDLPSESLAETLRRLLGLRKSVRPSDKQRATLARFQFRRDKVGVSSRFSAIAEGAATPLAPTMPERVKTPFEEWRR
ncbi:hypothetical protein [Bradyrhizobium sp. URHC0002]